MASFVPILIQNPPFFSNLEQKPTRSPFLKIANNISKGYMYNISENKKIYRANF